MESATLGRAEYCGAMSQANVDIVKRSFDAIAEGDVDALLRLYDPAVEFLPLTGTRVESGGYRGIRECATTSR